MAAGAPVIACRSGGVVESVVENKTGVFFDRATTAGLIQAIKKFEKINIKPEECRAQARKFSKERFIKEIYSFVKSRI